jgi:hypothetical protein
MRNWELFALSVELWDMLRTSVKLDFQWSMMMEQENGRQKLERRRGGMEVGLPHGG